MNGRCGFAALLAILLGAGCSSPPAAPSGPGVADTDAAFHPEGSSFSGPRRLQRAVSAAEQASSGGVAGTFTLKNVSSKTVILASVEPASSHVSASSPGAMPYRVAPGASFSVTVSVRLPWTEAMTNGGVARVLTTDGETVELWLQLVGAPPQAGNPATAGAPGAPGFPRPRPSGQLR